MQSSVKQRGIFITGTDTGVGKTVLACRIIRLLEQSGIKTAPRKPVESGCALSADGNLIACDAQQMAGAMQNPISVDTICRYRFSQVASPARAATMQNTTLTMDDLLVACYSNSDEALVVEGAGGVLSPLTEQTSNGDLAKQLGIPLILVVADKLGCINHALLSLAVTDSLGLETLAVVMNRIPSDTPLSTEMDNFGELQKRICHPLFWMYDIDKRNSELSKQVCAALTAS